MHNIFLLVLVKSFEAGVHFSLEQLAYKVDPTVAAMLVYICKKNGWRLLGSFGKASGTQTI